MPRVLVWGKKKTNKHKEFWRDTPWCASRLSRGHVPCVPWYVPSVPGTFCPFSIDLHINQAQMSQVSLGRPEFVPGTSRVCPWDASGASDRQIPSCDFSLSVFSLHNFPDYVIFFYMTELVSNYLLGYVISCVVTKHTMWAVDYIT